MVKLIHLFICDRSSCLIKIGKTVKLFCPGTGLRHLFLAYFYKCFRDRQIALYALQD